MTRDTTPAPRRGRPPKGAEQLTRAAIVDAALKVIDTDGLGAVSMRAVARVLGVDAKSLYNHISDKDGLLDAVAEHILGGIELPPVLGDLDTDLRSIATAFRNRAMAHPEAATLVLTRQLASLDALAPVEVILGVLRGAGCPPDEAVHLMRTLVAALVGTLLREAEAGPTFGVTDLDAVAARAAQLEASGLPHVAASAGDLARFDRDAEFDYTLDFAVDLTKLRIERSRR